MSGFVLMDMSGRESTQKIDLFWSENYYGNSERFLTTKGKRRMNIQRGISL